MVKWSDEPISVLMIGHSCGR